MSLFHAPMLQKTKLSSKKAQNTQSSIYLSLLSWICICSDRKNFFLQHFIGTVLFGFSIDVQVFEGIKLICGRKLKNLLNRNVLNYKK